VAGNEKNGGIVFVICNYQATMCTVGATSNEERMFKISVNILEISIKDANYTKGTKKL